MGRAALLGTWFALLTGLGEWAYVGLLERQDLPMGLELGDHMGWMAPAANVPLFLALALVLVAVGRRTRVDGDALLAAGLSALATFAVLTSADVLHVLAVLLLSLGLGAQVWRTASNDSSFSLAFARRTLPAILLVVVLAGGFNPVRRHLQEERALGALPAATGNGTSVLLIILDTVRARSMSLYGHDRPTTPFLEELADRSVVFEKGIATAPWTLPSHGSMFTGRLPRDLSAGFNDPLDESFPTLAEVLGSKGYETAGFVANLSYGTRQFGLARGFLHYEDVPVSVGQALLTSSLWRTLVGIDRLREFVGHAELLNRKTAADVIGSFLSWLDARDADRPFFVFLNLFDAHEPYLPPAPFDTLFGPSRDQGRLEHEADLILGHKAARAPKQHSSEAAWAADRAAYEGAIAYMDRELGRLYDALSRRGTLAQTLVIITSDHGEHHGEHDLYEHTSSVYLPLIRVPLLIRPPGGLERGTRVSVPASLADLPATVMDGTGLSGHPFPGRSLARHWSGAQVATVSDTALSEHSHPVIYLGDNRWTATFPGPLRSAVTTRHHYIHVEGGSEQLFDLTVDPEETENLAEDPELADVVERLRIRTLPAGELASGDSR